MPYRIRKRGDQYVIQAKRGAVWHIKSHHRSRKLAEAASRLLMGVEHGWKPTGKKMGAKLRARAEAAYRRVN